MKEGTNKLLRTYYFIIQQILNRFSASKTKDKKILNEAFKSYYRMMYSVNHESLKDFNKDELRILINNILILFSVEYGVYLQQPNDPENAEEMSLSEYLEYKSWDMSETNNDLLHGVSALPEGFVLVEDINSLKRLKKGCRVRKDENLEWMYGKVLYVHSFSRNLYYKKILNHYTPITKLKEYINLKIVYHEQ